MQLDAICLEDDSENQHRIVKLRNPWGQKEWSGAYREDDEEFWRSIPDTEEKTVFRKQHENGNDGIFFMSYSDFCHYFN